MQIRSQTSLLAITAVGVLVLASRSVSSGGQSGALVRLQATTPGAAQVGNMNVTGTVRGGQFQGAGSGVTGVNADLLDGLNSTAFLQAVPNPLSLSGSSATQIIQGQNSSTAAASAGVVGISTAATNATYGVFGQSSSSSGLGVYGRATATSGQTFGVYGVSDSPTGIGLFGIATATSGAASGVYGRSPSPIGYGVAGSATATTGANFGVSGDSASTSGTGVFGYAYATAGLTTGVMGRSNSISGRGVYGENTSGGAGVNGVSTDGTGVRGSSDGRFGSGVRGSVTTTGVGDVAYGVHGYASTLIAGYAVFASGDMGASGVKPFRIDHPTDPLNKFLLHYSTESPFPQNFYNGNVTTDSKGYAWVELPAYFSEINTNFKYVLTVIGKTFAQAIVSEEISQNRFQIKTNQPNIKVSWRVDADRNDERVKFNRPTDVREKSGPEKGKYQHPEYFGMPPEMGMNHTPPR